MQRQVGPVVLNFGGAANKPLSDISVLNAKEADECRMEI